jgi:hypothetical protein
VFEGLPWQGNRKGRSRGAAFFVFNLYFQDTKSDYKTCQISSVVLAWKWRGILRHYFGFFHKPLTVFGVNPWGETVWVRALLQPAVRTIPNQTAPDGSQSIRNFTRLSAQDSVSELG